MKGGGFFDCTRTLYVNIVYLFLGLYVSQQVAALVPTVQQHEPMCVTMIMIIWHMLLVILGVCFTQEIIEGTLPNDWCKNARIIVFPFTILVPQHKLKERLNKLYGRKMFR